MIAGRISRLIGSGDYSVSGPVQTNSLMKRNSSDPSYASFGSVGTGIRLRYREYLRDIVSPGPAFSVTGIPVQPALVSAFPYLSSIAKNFDEYIFHGLVFEFVSSTSPFSTNPAMGNIILSVESDPTDSLPISKQMMENSDYAVSARPDRNLVYGAECKGQPTTGLFTRTGMSLNPLAMTDFGLFLVATSGLSAAVGTTLGELWVSYDIELRKPQLNAIYNPFWRYSASFINGQALSFSLPAPSSTAASNVELVHQNISVNFHQLGDINTVYLPSAVVGETYQVLIRINTGTTGSGTAPQFQNFNACVSPTSWRNDTQSNPRADTSVSAYASGFSVAYITITGLNPSFDLSKATAGAGATNIVVSFDFTITLISPNGSTPF